jgi:hypothetical protein
VAHAAEAAAGAVADGAKAVGRGAKAAAKAVGGAISSAASSLVDFFSGGRSLPDSVKEALAEKKKELEEKKKAHEEIMKKAKAQCEATAAVIVKREGLDKAIEYAKKVPALQRMKTFMAFDLVAQVALLVTKVRTALLVVTATTARVTEIAKQAKALAESKKRALVEFCRCAQAKKDPA